MEFFVKGKADKILIEDAHQFYNGVINSASRKRNERLWFENNAFYEGFQWLEYNFNTQEYLFYKDYTNGKIKTQVNLIQSITDKQLSRIVKKKPRLIGSASNSNSNSQLWLIANQLSSVFEYVENKMEMDVKLYEVMLEAFTCGMGWLNFFWDDNFGDDVAKEVPILDNAGNIVGTETKYVNTGDVNSEVFNAFDVIISPSVQRYENIRRLQSRRYQNPDEIFEQYGIKVDADRRADDDSTFNRKYRNLINKVSGGQDLKLDDSVMKLVDYQRPSIKYPKGRYLVYANGVVLDYKEELPTGDINFVPFWCKKRHNKFLGDTFIRQLIPPQKQKNRLTSLQLEIAYNHAYPYWMVEKGSGLLKKGIKGEPMQILEYNQGSKAPMHSPPPPMPAYVQQLNEMTDQAMMDISSQHEVTKGVNPSGLNNNQALINLMEADDVTLSLIEQLFYRSYEMCGNKIKNIISQGYDEERMIQVSGDNAPNFSGSGFTFSRDSAKALKDVRVHIESVPDLPYSRSGRIQLVNDMAQSGLLNMADPVDKNIARKIVDFTGVVNEKTLDEKNAIRENMLAKEGQPIDPPVKYEDHMVHLYTHYTWMKTPEYKALVKMNPKIHAVMMQHTEMTEQLIPPPPKPEIPTKVNVQVKSEATPGSGDKVLIDSGVVQPPPPPPQIGGPGAPVPGGLPLEGMM